jgi:hypothetical protein
MQKSFFAAIGKTWLETPRGASAPRGTSAKEKELSLHGQFQTINSYRLRVNKLELELEFQTISKNEM